MQAYALKTHHRVAHLKIRSFACTFEGCGKTYAHMSNLNQHIAAHNRAEEAPLVQATAAAVAVTPVPVTQENDTALLTGNVMAIKRYGCPAPQVIQHELEGHARCNLRFWRVYDVRRHLKADHGLDLEDAELRQLLGDVGTADFVHGHEHDIVGDAAGRNDTMSGREAEMGGFGDIPIDPQLMTMT